MHRRVPGGLHSSTEGRAEVRAGRQALYRSGRVHRLRRLRARLPGRSHLCPRWRAREVEGLHRNRRPILSDVAGIRPFARLGPLLQRREKKMSVSDNSTWKQQMLNRVQGEFLEMPGLRLRIEQAQRLWGLDRSTCEDHLTSLVEATFPYRRAAQADGLPRTH